MPIGLYEVNEKYVDYLVPHAPHLFHNKKPGQSNNRKYIGVILEVNGYSYFAPLSSFKEKHTRMQETIDFLKIGNKAVININNMFPVPSGMATRVDINAIKNRPYRDLLREEYRIIKVRSPLIFKNAKVVYDRKLKDKNSALAKRCNDFAFLEELCQTYKRK